MKRLALALFTCTLIVGYLLPAQDDLSGTWIGDTIVPNVSDKDTFTLVLKKSGDSYTGTIADSSGIVDATLENVRFENGTLSFSLVVPVNGQKVAVVMTLKLKEGRLVGSWDADLGMSGPLDMSRKTD